MSMVALTAKSSLMKSVYIREKERYTSSSFARALCVNNNEAIRYIQLLCTQGVLKPINKNDLKSCKTESKKAPGGTYQFIFVGLVLLEGFCLVVYPKYFPLVSIDNPSEETKAAMRRIISVLRKSGKQHSQIAVMAEESMQTNDRIALMLMLLEMYDEYGPYTNYLKEDAHNGFGNINWERTIASNLPFLIDNRPIYFTYNTTETSQDSSDFVMRLHMVVLTACSRFMQDSSLASLLELDAISLSDNSIEDFGDVDSIIYRLECERNRQFITWKQDVIDLLLWFIENDGCTLRQDMPICLGTSSFYHVWEEACRTAFDDALKKNLSELDIELAKSFDLMDKQKLIDIIPRPQWVVLNANTEEKCGKVKTLVPDTVLLQSDVNGDSVFAILDAKYYTPELGETINGAPGVESVSKQLLYQSAYREFVLAHSYSRVVNAFLIPTAGMIIKHLGRVSFPGVIAEEAKPFSNTVELYAIPDKAVFDAYLAGEPLDNASLLAVIQ